MLNAKNLGLLYVILIEYRFSITMTPTLADGVFPLLFAMTIAKHKDQLFLNHHLKLVFIFTFAWIVSFLLPALNQDFTLKSYFLSNYYYLAASLYTLAIGVVFYQLTLVYGKNYFAQIALTAGLLYGALPFLGIALEFFGIKTGFICPHCTSGPYLEGFPRFKGFSHTPNGFAFMTFSALMGLFYLWDSHSKRARWAKVTFLGICLFCSMSKTLLIALVASTIWALKRRFALPRYVIGTLLAGGLTCYTIATHITPKADQSRPCIYGNNSQFIHYFRVGETELCPTLFVELKELYTGLTSKYWPWGMGASNKIADAQRPHCAYFERLALHGLAGVISLALLIFLIIKCLSVLKSKTSFLSAKQWDALSLFWAMILFISLNEDTLRFRLVWVFIGGTLALVTMANKQKERRP